MSDNAPYRPDELPELSDEDIALLHSICTAANSSNAPPFKALFAAYDTVFAEQGIEQEHDGVVFRFLLRVGEAAREGGGRGGRVDLVGCLKSILQALGITVVEDDESGVEDVTRETNGVDGSLAVGNSGARDSGRGGRRRVSFNDARMDETWLSEHSRSIGASPPRQQPGQRGLLSQPARRGRIPDAVQTRRARSISSQRHPSNISRQAAPKHFQTASPSTVYTSDADDHANPTLLFQPSQTQLELNAKAFASTSSIRTARRCLHIWHDRALLLRQSEQQASATATAHDHRTLLKQAFDQWRTHLSARKQESAQQAERERLEHLAEAHYKRCLRIKSFTHWLNSTQDQQNAMKRALERIIQIRFFYRWKALTLENAQKARSILAKKYLAVWRDRLARRQLREEQAEAVCEESQVKRCWRAWFWQFCSRRVEGWREDKSKKRAFDAWAQRLDGLRTQEQEAQQLYERHNARHALHALRQRLGQWQDAAQRAQGYHDQTVQRHCFRELIIRSRLEPIARTLTLKVQLDLQRKAFRVWHLHLTLSRQAADVDRKRVLQSAWTSWNDSLRCNALAQKIDERVLVENLYKWVLAERLKLFRRTMEGRVARQAFSAWSERLVELRTRFRDAEVTFAGAQERRLLSSAMVKLHLAVRHREDAERAAVEFSSARALPNALGALTEKLREVQQLHKWSRDARFYTLCTRILAIWRERTTMHQQNRKRDAYARVRARVKIRLAGQCLQQWQAKAEQYRAMDEESGRRAQARQFAVATHSFDQWRERTVQLRDMEAQATALDRQKLENAAVSALALRYADLVALDQRADAFRRDTELAVLAAALKKVQWAQFTAARRAESAEALWARNRDNHVRNMVRVWATQTVTRRAARQQQQHQEGDQEPESPSLRPASRAASRSAQRPYVVSSPPTAGATPAYMRTPSRSRRAGRFRPLPTPAAGTPFAFDQAYLATTPAPLPGLPAGFTQELGDGALTPQVTPFARKLRAGGFGGSSRTAEGQEYGDSGLAEGDSAGLATPAPAPALRSSVFGRPLQGTAKSVRFAGSSRFGSEQEMGVPVGI